MRSILFCCCDSAIIDVVSQRLSIVNFWEALNAPAFPISIPSTTIVAWVERDADEPKKVEILTRWLLNKSKLADLPVEIDFQEQLSARAILNVSGLTVESPGILEVQLRSGRKKLATWRIRVQQTAGPRAVKVRQETATKTSTSKAKAKAKAKG